jgi:hypothetical protein
MSFVLLGRVVGIAGAGAHGAQNPSILAIDEQEGAVGVGLPLLSLPIEQRFADVRCLQPMDRSVPDQPDQEATD